MPEEALDKLKSLNKILRKKGLKREAYIISKIYDINKFSASIESIKKIKDWFGENKSALSFNDLFDGKLRTIIPFETKKQKELTAIILFLKKNGWHPSGGNNFFEIKKVKQKLRELNTGEEYEEDVEVADLKVSKSEIVKIPTGPRKGQEVIKERTLTISKVLSNPKNNAPEWMYSWWQKMQSEYVSNYNWKQIESIFKEGALETAHSIIISRNPIDVLRMSDHENIRSCHSEGQSYFNCAISEAKGNGLIAYLVNSDELNKLLTEKTPWGWDPENPRKINIDELDNQEIFADRDRGISGIRPKSRLRLRKYVNEYDGYEFAAPEHRTYGPCPPGFKEVVRSWAWEKQNHLFDYIDNENVNIPEIEELEMHGGSYRDTSDGQILNAFFLEGNVDGRFYGNAETISEDEDSTFDMWEAEIDDIMERATIELEHIDFHAYVEMGGDGPYTGASAYATCEIPLYGWKDIFFENNHAETSSGFYPIPLGCRSEGYDEFVKLLNHDDAEDIEYEISKDETALIIRLTFGCYDCHNPDDCYDFFTYIKDDVDTHINEYKEKVRNYLLNAEYIGKIEFDNVKDRLSSKPLSYFDIYGIDEDDHDGEILISSKPESIPISLTIPKLRNQYETERLIQTYFKAKKLSKYKYLLKEEAYLIIENLNKMAKESYEYAKRQLNFDFYDNDYQMYDYTNIIKDLSIKAYVNDNKIKELTIEIKINIENSEEQILLLEKFVNELDKEFQNIVWKIVQNLIYKLNAAKKSVTNINEAFYNGTYSYPIIQSLKSLSQPDVQRLALWIEKNWNNFTNAEKEVAHYEYLIPTRNDGDYIHNDEDSPRFWNTKMQRRPDIDIGYRWKGLSMKNVMPYTDLSAPIREGLPEDDNILSDELS